MTLDSLAGLPQFLRYLGTFPTPVDVLTALRSGPFASFGMFAGYLWLLVDDRELVALASIGFTREEADRYKKIPMGLDLPVVDAVRRDTARIDAAPSFGVDYLGAIDKAFWDRLLQRTSAISLLSAPITHAGQPVGALGMVTDRTLPDDAASHARVDAVGAALALWITHPRTGIAVSPAPPRAQDWSLAFSERQTLILRMVEGGASSAAIARFLGLSESTVKHDLQRVMRSLRATDRATAVGRARALGLL